MHYLVKVQLVAVERNRGHDIVHDLPDADTGHHVSSAPVTGIVDPWTAAPLATKRKTNGQGGASCCSSIAAPPQAFQARRRLLPHDDRSRRLKRS